MSDIAARQQQTYCSNPPTACNRNCTRRRISSMGIFFHFSDKAHGPETGIIPLHDEIASNGLLLFPVAEMYFFRCGNFLGCKAGLSLLLVFFLPRPVFFLPRTGFFPLPPKCIFSAAKVLLCCCKVFFLLL